MLPQNQNEDDEPYEKELEVSDHPTGPSKQHKGTTESSQEASVVGVDPVTTKRVEKGNGDVGLDEFGSWKMSKFKAFARDILLPDGGKSVQENLNKQRNQQRTFDGYVLG